MTGFKRAKGRNVLALAALTLVLVAPTSVPVEAQGPDSVANLVAPLLDAVVNISTSQDIAGGRGSDAAPNLPDGSPFQDFFDQFFGNDGNSTNTRPRRVQSLGSGFVVDPSGLIVTNNHVIENADEITVNFNDGTKLPAVLKGHDAKTDIALLQVTADKPLTYVQFGDSTKLRVGDWVMAIGNPFGLGGTVTVGIVSARNRNINSGPYDDYIQTDAAINRGNSGGPLFDETGKVIGINTAIISPSGGSIGIGFSVPSEIAMGVVDQLRDFGETRRGWLGVRIQDVTDEIAKSLAMDSPRGALVADVDKSGPAEAAGILAGDVILEMDGKQVDASHVLPRLVANEPVGKTVTIIVLRDGKQMPIQVTLGRLEDAEKATTVAANPPDATVPPDTPPDASTPPDAGAAPPDVTANAMGLTLDNLSAETRGQYGIAADVSGVVVTSVQQGSAAADKRIEAGDVIAMVGEEQVASTDDFDTQIAALKKAGRSNVKLVVQNKQGHVRFVNLPLDQ